MKYPFIESPKQTTEYYVLHALESGCHPQAYGIEGYLNRKMNTAPVMFTRQQISAALQRLKKAGLVTHDGRWLLAKPAEGGN